MSKPFLSMKEQLMKNGHWLFRWRSFLPLIVLALLIPTLNSFQFFGGRHLYDEIWEFFCLGISLLGLGIRFYTIGYAPGNTSGRNTKAQVADQLNTTGIYSLVRNPLYLGNFLIWLGISLYPHQVWLIGLVVLIFTLYHERIVLAEENFLENKFGDYFREWAGRTPAFVPRTKNWVRPIMSFSWRHALKREYLGFFAIISIFTLLEAAGHYRMNHRFFPDTHWLCLFLFSCALFLVIRVLRKNTHILDVVGR